MEVDIHEAKTHLSGLLERVALGEEVIIAKAGKPVAKLVAITPSARKFKLGSAKGKLLFPMTSTTRCPMKSRISSGHESLTARTKYGRN
jgi:prevent-host-death family protein